VRLTPKDVEDTGVRRRGPDYVRASIAFRPAFIRCLPGRAKHERSIACHENQELTQSGNAA
jgi:hypothetical protein